MVKKIISVLFTLGLLLPINSTVHANEQANTTEVGY